MQGWLTCKSHHDLGSYGLPQTLVGRTFKVVEKYRNKASFSPQCDSGKIHSVVRRPVSDEESTESIELYFRVYDHTRYRRQPPPLESEAYCYVKCKDFLSSNVKRRMMMWDPLPSNEENKNKKRRNKKKKRTWAMEVAKPALYDNFASDIKGPRRSGSKVGLQSSEESITNVDSCAGTSEPTVYENDDNKNSEESGMISLSASSSSDYSTDEEV